MISRHSKLPLVIAVILLLVLTACGESQDTPTLSISGKVTVDEAASGSDADVFAAIFRGSGPDMTAQKLEDSFEGITRVAPDGSFSMDLTESGLEPGDTVTLVAFLDRNDSGGIPTPDEGDVLGFYIRKGSFTPSYPLQSGANSGADIHVSREVFDFDKEITGTLTGEYTGPVHLFAYAGEIGSLDSAALEVDSVIGYGSLEKKEAERDYRLKILPYGFDLPISGVYLLALFDANGNGKADEGEAVGCYSTHPRGLPTLFTLTEAPQEHFTLASEHSLPIPAVSPEAVTLSGQVERPDGYDEHSKAPLFIIAAETEDPGRLFSEPFSVVRAFERLAPGQVNFDMDLSSAGLAPGDTLMVLALWDRNHTEDPDNAAATGFPSPDAGDLIGYYQDKAQLSVSHTLSAGRNHLVPFEDGDSALRFEVNRLIVAHDASLLVSFESGGRTTVAPGDQLLVIAAQKDGVNNTTYQITDPDYIVAMASVTVTEDTKDAHSVPLMGALLESIVTIPFGVDQVYVFAVLDENVNGKPDSDEPVGAYRKFIFPGTTSVKDGKNRLDKPLKFW